MLILLKVTSQGGGYINPIVMEGTKYDKKVKRQQHIQVDDGLCPIQIVINLRM